MLNPIYPNGVFMIDQAKGVANDVVGKAQDAYGGATGDFATQLKGKARQAAGKAQQTYGEALSTVRDAAASSPVASLAVAAGIGFLLGVLWTRRE
jgi:uncharacterized protein YjbJ (UPF0337 family)